MKTVWFFRISAVILFLFGALHTVGFLSFRPASPEGLAVWNSMLNIHFEEKGAVFSYGNFYKGFGLFISLFLFFSAALAWHFSNAAQQRPASIRAIAWLFFLLQAGNVVLAAIYFGLPQMVFASVVAICAGLAAFWLPAESKSKITAS